MHSQPHRFLTRVILPAMLLAGLFPGCTNPPPANGELTRSPTLAGWRLTELYGNPVTADPAPTLTLYGPDGRASGNAGVNRFSTEFKAGAGGLKAGPIMSTKMAGPPERMELERLYLQAIDETTAWQMKGSELDLLAGERLIARFTSQPADPEP